MSRKTLRIDPLIKDPEYHSFIVPTFYCNMAKQNIYEKYRYKPKNRLPDDYSYVHIGTKPPSRHFHYYPKRIKQYQKSAENRNLEWELDNKTAFELFGSACYYCGKDGPGGIDRINSNIGYLTQNVVPCCSQCNYAKGRLSAEQFIRMCHQIANNLSIKQGIDLDDQAICQ